MDLVVNKINKVKGKIAVPGDKSISHRSIMLGGMAEGTSYIHNLLLSEDIKSTMACLEKLGVVIRIKDHTAIVQGMKPRDYKPYGAYLDAGNSGTTIRLLLGLVAGSKNSYCFTGDRSLSNRPMKRVTDPLSIMGANIHFMEKKDTLPITIKGGNLEGISYRLPVASAQVKSAIILAALQASGRTIIEEPAVTRDHTEIMANYFGCKIEKEDHFIKVEGNQNLIANEIFVPGDISSAAFLIVLALTCPNSELLIENVGLNPTRTGILDVLQAMGAKIEIISEKIANGEKYGDILVKHSHLRGVTVEGNIIPRLIDEIPILAVAAALSEGKTVIKDASELKVKESNRIKMMVNGLRKMGADIIETDDGMMIEGPNRLKGAVLDSGGDHRIAMAFAIAGMLAEGETRILGSDCIAVSFPEFEHILKEITQ